ncbi:MAG: hypothetical protein P8Z71_00820 [Candidatus Sulfobium sp.]
MRKRHYYLLVTVAIMAVMFFINLATPLGFVDWVGYLFCLLLAYQWLSRRGIGIMTILCALLVLLDFVFSPASLLHTDIDTANRLIGISVLCLSAYLLIRRKSAEEDRERLIVELRQALENVKKLSGMLPICASCKKIRDDKGYWEDVADYITGHSEVLFSHGLCPDCAEKTYEEIDRLKRDG